MKSIKLRNGDPVEMIESNVLLPGHDVLWTDNEWQTYLNSVQVNTSLMKEDIHGLAGIYQDKYYDVRGVAFLQNLKLDLITNYPTYATMLPYQMIEAVNRWINKVWAKAFEYDATLNADVDFDVEVGLPPCAFRDILWVVDPSYQAFEPNRPVNQDINYYINWN